MPLLKAYLPGTPRLVAVVELGRKDAWKSLGGGGGREVSVLTAHIQGAVVHHGTRSHVSSELLIGQLIITSLQGTSITVPIDIGASVNCWLPRNVIGYVKRLHPAKCASST